MDKEQLQHATSGQPNEWDDDEQNTYLSPSKTQDRPQTSKPKFKLTSKPANQLSTEQRDRILVNNLKANNGIQNGEIDEGSVSSPNKLYSFGEKQSDEMSHSYKKKKSTTDHPSYNIDDLKKKSNQQLKLILEKQRSSNAYKQEPPPEKEKNPNLMNLNVTSISKTHSESQPNTFSLNVTKSPMKASRPPLRESNPNSYHKKEIEKEEQKLNEEEDKQLKEQQITNERLYYKLADYFCTIGIDDYYTKEEVYKTDLKKKSKTLTSDISTENTVTGENTEASRVSLKEKDIDKEQLKNMQFPSIEEDIDFNQVVSKMEVYVINDHEIFNASHSINGVEANLKHPDTINSSSERWIDLTGEKSIYLKVLFEDSKTCKRPITDFNFFWISRYKQQPDKMSIHIKQNIEPTPVKLYGVADSEQKHRMTKCIGKNGGEDTYNFYGNYDLSSYLEDMSKIDPATQKKNLCLCTSKKRAPPIQDIILCVGQKIDKRTGQTVNDIQDSTPENDQAEGKIKDITVNWEVPDGYKKLAYCIKLNRLLCHRARDILKRKIKAKVIDRYPPIDRHYYPFPNTISDFCFPSGITLKTEEGSPEFFHFNLTDQDGKQIYATCLIFDEEPSILFREKLKSLYTKNTQSIRAVKAICILSHYSFNSQFKDILKQLYRMQVSNTRSQIPLERYIINIIEEIPLPDEGTRLIQHEIGGQMMSFYRPNDQNPPLVDKTDIENLFRCLNVDHIIEIYSYLLLERKVLVISKHKALITQVINTFQCFLFPFQWKHTLIPILPVNLLDMLESPMPYFVGVEPHPRLEYLEIHEDVIRVDLDNGEIHVPEQLYLQSSMPAMPNKEQRKLRQRILKASEMFEQVPDPDMFEQVDKAFMQRVEDPEEVGLFDHYEVRDAFLEFIQFIMQGYTKYIIDPSQQPEQISCFKDCFDVDKFRLTRDAKKPYTFIYKFTDTIHFSYFIESRSLGRSDRDAQIIHFEKLMQQTRTRINPRLIHPFHEEKSIKTMQPNEEGIDSEQTYRYGIFPKLDLSFAKEGRQIPDYNMDAFAEQIMGQMIKKEDLIKMHDAEWARYMLEVLYLLWFQVFSSTLPIYVAHASKMIDFAKKLLNIVNSKIKPMRDIEYIYRKLFYSCGTCKSITELRELHKDMLKNKVQPDKITSGTYYHALLQCKRRGGTKEAPQEKAKQYFQNKMEDFHKKLKDHQDDDNRSNNGSMNRMSNLSLGQKLHTQNSGRKNSVDEEVENFNGVDFGDILDRRDSTQLSAQDRLSKMSNSVKLSNVLENSLLMDIETKCSKCKDSLREEEILTGFKKDINDYTVKCPKCNQPFVPKFTIYSEQENIYIQGKKGQKINLLPPITLYKQFFNLVTQKGDEILMDESFIHEHQTVYWNIILYFKILKLPIFMLDLDYSPYHQKTHCLSIKKFLPVDKKSIFGMSSSKRQNSYGRPPQKLDSNALKQLEIASGHGSGGFINSMMKGNSPKDTGDNVSQSGLSNNGGRQNSLKRSVFGMFSSNKKNKQDNRGSFAAKDSLPDDQQYAVPTIGNRKPQIVGQDQKINDVIKRPGGGIQAIHYDDMGSNGDHSLKPPTATTGETEKKGFGSGIQSIFNNFKRPGSTKGGSSQKSAGAGSVVTTLSDLENIEKIMNEAQFADKSIVKYFGKHLEEFRREMHYNKEIIFSDMMLAQFGVPIQDQESQIHNRLSTGPVQMEGQSSLQQ